MTPNEASAFLSFLDEEGNRPPPPAPAPKAGVARTVADLGVKAAQGVVGLGQSVVGLGSLATGGLAGQAMRSIGYDPQRATEMLGEYLSPDQQAADRAVQQADGFVDTLSAAVKNPRAIAGSVAESVPGMLAIGGLSRMVAQRIAMQAAGPFGGVTTAEGAAAAQQAVEAASTRLLAASGITEGAQSAGQIADQAQAAGRSYGDYALPAVAAGAGTGAITMLAGKTIGDPTTALFTRSQATSMTGGLPARAVKGAASEAAQEGVQSGQEQAMTNVAMGDPIEKGVGGAAAMGVVTGAAMGVGEGAAAPRRTQQEAANDVRAAETVPEVGPLSAAANVATESKAQAIEVAQPAEPEPPVVDGILERIKRMEGQDRTDAAHHYGVVQRGEQLPKGVVNFNTKQLERLLAKYEDQNAKPLDMPAADTGPVAPDLTTEPGAQPDVAAVDFRREIPTGDLALVDPAEEARARAAQVDFQPADTTPDLTTEPGAAAPRDGIDMPAPAVDTGSLALAPQPGAETAAQAGQTAPAAPASTPAGTPAPAPGEDWQVFPENTGTLKVPRAEMPQIKSEHHGPLVNYLNARGIAHETLEVDPATLKPTQQEYSESKAAGMADIKDGDRSVLVSSDGYVLDGHHQWLGAGSTGKPLKVIKLDAPIADLLPLARSFPSATTATQDPATAPATAPAIDTATEPAADARAGEDGAAAGPANADAAVGVVPAGGEPAAVAAAPVAPTGEQNAADAIATPATAAAAPDAAGAGGLPAGQPASDGRDAAAAEQVAAASTAPKPLTVGRTPAAADAVSVRGGVVHLGRYPAYDHETGEPITVPAGATPQQIKEALRKGGALSSRQKFFGEHVAQFSRRASAHATIKANTFGPTTMPTAALRRKAMSWADENLADKSFTNENTGAAIKVTRQGVKHGLSSANAVEVRLVAGLGEMLSKARLLRSEPDKLGRPDIKAIHHYAATATVGGEHLDVGLVVREMKDGQRYYDHFLLQKQTPAEAGAAPPDGTSGAAPSRELGDQPASGGEGIVPKASRSGAEPSGLMPLEIQQAVSELTRDWQRKPDLHVLDSIQDAPKPVLRVFNAQNQQGAEGTVRAFHYRGGVYLLADSLGTQAEVQEALYHEALGHFGLRGVFGDKLKPLLKQLAAARPQLVQRKAQDYGLDLEKEGDRLLAAEEVLAELAGTHPELGFVKRAVAIIRAWLREHVPGFDKLRMTDADIVAKYILPARDFVVKAKSQAPSFAPHKAPAMASRTAGEELSGDDLQAALEDRGEQVMTRMDAERRMSDGERIYALHEGADDPHLLTSVKDLAAYTPDQMMALPAESEDSAAFSRAPALGPLTPEQQKAFENVAGVNTKATVGERMKELRQNFKVKVTQGLFDQFAPIKDLGQREYMLARLSKAGDGTMEAAMLYGRPFLRDGVPDVDVKDGGFAKVLADLHGEHDRFLWWVAAQRAEQLKGQGRENLFTDADITHLKTLSAGAFADGSARGPVYTRALRELNAFNDASLKMAVQSGLIGQDAYEVMKEQPYVPFYRVLEEDGELPKFRGGGGGLLNQEAFKRLKGGSSKVHNDLLQNVLLNWSHLFTASAKNRAALAALKAAESMAVAYEVPAGTKDAVKVMEGGQAKHYTLEDPYLMEAITSLHYMPSPLLKPLIAVKNLLTLGVTANPAFKIRNLIRDSLAAIAQADLSANPFKNVAHGWKKTARDSQTYASMLASGGLIRFGTTEDSSRVRRQIASLGGEMLDAKGWEKLSQQARTVWEAYQELGDRGENVNRAALYERLKAKGHDHAEASFMARDLLDFSMGGKWATVRFLASTVPFLNARLQGLFKLGRAAAEDPKRFGAMAAAVSMASIALMLAYSDDEDWKKREDWDRDTNWWFKIGDKAFRIPRPFELGSLGTLAERTLELMVDDEMTPKRYRERLSNMIAQTFAFDPTPQIVKPLVDLYGNRDSFTMRPIEKMGDERLRPQDRYNDRTSELGVLLGQLGMPDPAQLLKGNYSALSPKQVDFLLKAYAGWFGTVAMTASDYMIRPLTDRGAKPSMQLRDVFLAGNFIESVPTGTSRYVNTLYENAKAVEQAWGSYHDALRRGDAEGAEKIRDDEGEKLAAYHPIERIKRGESKLSALEKRIEADKSLSSSEKATRLENIAQRRHELARQAPTIH